jgi:trigger factor
MSVALQTQADQTTFLSVSLKKEEYEKQINDAIKKVAKQIVIKGFRPGMAPLGLVKKMHGNAILIEEVNKLLNDKVFNYIRENNLDILGQPMPSSDQPFLDLTVDNIKDIDFKYEIGLAPAVNFDFLTTQSAFKKYKVKVEENMIDDEVSRLQSRFASYEYPENVEEKDVLMFTIEELDEQGNIKEAGVSAVSSLSIEMFKETARPAILALTKHTDTTLNIWEALDREVDAIKKHVLNLKPEDSEKEIGNSFKFTLTNITRSKSAEINDEFFKKVYGEGGVQSETEMRDLIKADLENYFDGQSDSFLINDLHKFLMENISMELPDAFMKRWIKTVNEKEITDEQIENDYPQFAKQIRWNLIVKKVVNEQQLSVSKEELYSYVKSQTIAQMYGYGMKNIGDEWIDQFVDKQMKDKKYVEQMSERILDDKALQYIKTQVKLSDQLVTFDEFKAKVETGA